MSTRYIPLLLVILSAHLNGQAHSALGRTGSLPALPPLYIQALAGEPVYIGRAGGVAARFERDHITLRSPEGLVTMRFPGANPLVELVGESPSVTAVHVLRGNDESAWQRNLLSIRN